MNGVKALRMQEAAEEKIGRWLRTRYGVTNGVAWEDEPQSVRDRWSDEASTFMHDIGLRYNT